jgi:hypothetical protein
MDYVHDKTDDNNKTIKVQIFTYVFIYVLIWRPNDQVQTQQSTRWTKQTKVNNKAKIKSKPLQLIFLKVKLLIDWNLPDKDINAQYCNIVTRYVLDGKQVVLYILYINSFPFFIYLGFD